MSRKIHELGEVGPGAPFYIVVRLSRPGTGLVATKPLVVAADISGTTFAWTSYLNGSAVASGTVLIADSVSDTELSGDLNDNAFGFNGKLKLPGTAAPLGGKKYLIGVSYRLTGDTEDQTDWYLVPTAAVP